MRALTIALCLLATPALADVAGPDGEIAVALLPKRALTLAQELLTRGVQAIKADSWDSMYGPGAPQRGPDLGAASHDRSALGQC